jgi:Mg-chelatase subunit ChlI
MPAEDEATVPFPLTAIVGHDSLKRGLMLAAVNPRIPSVLVSGERDTGKRTAAHGLAGVLPPMQALEECPVQCQPGAKELCPACRSWTGKHKAVPVRTPFVEIPISVSEQRLLGWSKGERHVAGLLAQANGGFAFMERLNLFGEPVVERVLKVMDKGEVRAGGYWPASFSLVATMNEEDGELPEELASRFAMKIWVRSLADIEERLEILRRVEAYNADPRGFASHYAREESLVREKVANARRLLERADVPKKVLAVIERVCGKVGADGKDVQAYLREAALANAVYNGRNWATVEDVAEVADFVLGHRRG